MERLPVVAIRTHDIAALLVLSLLCGCGRPQPRRADYETIQRQLKEGQLPQALAGAEAGLHNCGSSEELCWRFRILNAETLLLMRKPKAALSLLEVAGGPAQQELQAERRMHQGQAWASLSDSTRAEKFFTEARQLANASGSPLLAAQVDLRQSALWSGTDRFDEAVAALHGVADTAIREGDPYLQANAMGQLGYLFFANFRYDLALQWLQRAYDLSIRIGAGGSAATTIGNRGWCYFRLGDSEKALADFSEAEKRAASVGDNYHEQLWLGDSGNVFFEAGDLPAAISRYTRALKIARDLDNKKWMAKWLTNLAEAAVERGELDEAEKHNNEALEINLHTDTREERFNQLTAARIAMERNQFDQAEAMFRSLENSAHDDPTPALDAQARLADLYVRQGDPRADAQFRSAIATIEGRQAGLTKDDYKFFYLSSLVRFYQNYVDFLVRHHDTDRALEVVESSRARILTERTKARGPAPRGVNASSLKALARSSRRILLSYWLTDKQSYLWAIGPGKIELFKLPPEKQIRELVESYRTAIEDLRDPLESHHPAGEKLSQILLGPIRELAPAGSRVTIVPDGALHALNFDTLPGVNDPSKYWIEDVTISVAPSLGLLLNSHPAKSSQPSLLAIGDPEPAAGDKYPRLPHAHKEMEAIAALFRPANKLVYERAAAQPSVYKAADPARFSLIHFAAHATANGASPLDSALILSRGENGYTLTARDIRDVRLDAELVTLSSCRSAGARAYSGEGLVGLAWAFLEVGARRVIAGLWDVNDESTSKLMTRLYTEMTSGKPAEDALRAAKLSLLRDGYPYRKPYYWGPFQLYTGTGK